MSLSLSSHAALVLWTQLAALLTTARLLGALVRRFGQPDIVGSLLAGVLLGPSVLGRVWPGAEGWLVPRHDQGQLHLLGAVTGFSLLILLIVLGAEVDLTLLRRLGRAAASVSVGSIVVPAAACIATVWLLVGRLSPGSRHPGVAALALGGALSVSSLPVVARIIMELRLGRRDAGQLSLAAATVNDVYGFLLLVPITVLAGSGGLEHIVLPVAGLVVVTALLLVAGQRVVDALLRRIRTGGPTAAGSVTVSVAFALGMAAVAQAVEIDAALGAFAAGVVLGRSRFQYGVALRSIETYTAAVFAPLYFSSAGLQIDLATIWHGAAMVAFGIVLAVTVAAKFAGAFLGAATARVPARGGTALGLALNGRGAMQVIIGTAALRLGVIDEAGFTVLLLISILTSVAVSPLLRRTVGGWSGTEAEQQRLAREEQLAQNVIVKGQRLLLPTRGGRNARAAALVMDRAWPEESELTLLTIVQGGEPAPSLDLDGTARAVRHLQADGDHVIDAILAEANLGYGVIGVGAVEEPSPDRLLPPGIAELLNRSPLPLLLVRRARGGEPTREFRRVVAGVNGTAASRAGQEVAHSLGGDGGEVHLLHVVSRAGRPAERAKRWPGPFRTSVGAATQVAADAADAVLAEAHGVAERQGVSPILSRRLGPSAGEEIVEFARGVDADAVVVGTRVRRVRGRPFLGHTVEYVLGHATGTSVIAVVLPDTGSADGEPYADRQER